MTILWLLTATSVAPFTLTPLLADEPDNIRFGEETMELELGYFLPRFNTRMRVDSKTRGRGDEVDLEDDLGYQREVDVARMDGHFRFARRHRVFFGYFAFTRSTTHQIDEEFQVGDETYAINTTIRSEAKKSIYDIGYDYSFLQGADYNLALGLGIHVIAMEWQISNSSGGQVERAEALAPLPLLTLDFKYALSPHWHTGIHYKYLALEFGQYTGEFTNLRAKLVYFPFQNVGFGFGIDHFNMMISSETSRFKGSLNWEYTGAQVFTTIRY